MPANNVFIFLYGIALKAALELSIDEIRSVQIWRTRTFDISSTKSDKKALKVVLVLMLTFSVVLCKI